MPPKPSTSSWFHDGPGAPPYLVGLTPHEDRPRSAVTPVYECLGRALGLGEVLRRDGHAGGVVSPRGAASRTVDFMGGHAAAKEGGGGREAILSMALDNRGK
ncbi:hypothetical protein Vretimale_3010 [Volvox reticuliferus]|uniref:Uncharacterized protein n=1 Tax=Volvox reticuliferus TaxID=1737510 RepID=A0A8J4G103_9CHLO|nr:hypothetical protein Vretimale_3010 [Volvox reticuliferus]